MNELVIGQAVTGRSTIQNLRSCQSANAESRPSTAYVLSQKLLNFWYGLSLLFCKRSECDNSTCKYYGHIINKSTWSGAFPRCADCGIVIDNPKMLRSAAVKPSIEEKVDWRRYMDNRLVRSSEMLY